MKISDLQIDSPFEDAGYDIRDFYKVAPRYGDEADLARLFEEAHARGLRVILDLVPGHTSMDHAWFQNEAANPKDPDSNRYVWINRDFDPAVGPAKEDFLPSFFWYQPALNYGWDNPSEPARADSKCNRPGTIEHAVWSGERAIVN